METSNSYPNKTDTVEKCIKTGNQINLKVPEKHKILKLNLGLIYIFLIKILILKHFFS